MYYKKLLFLFFANLIILNLYAQTGTVNHWETVFYSDTIFKYKTSNEGLAPNNWRESSFDASGWNNGRGGIGNGDNDDQTVIATCNSVFMRVEFNIRKKSDIVAAILNIDYDDAFVAYLNGIEIARSKGLTDAFPEATVLSSTQHEALMPSGGKPETFLLDISTFLANLIEGSNTLAIQVHNATANSSDLSSNTWLSVGIKSSEKSYLPTPNWFSAPANLSALSSNLPILVIETNGQTIKDEPKITVHMGLIYNGEGKRNTYTDEFNEYNGSIGIEIRGNSTSGFAKKPYKFETRDSLGGNLNVSLLGMPSENDWILRASYLDHTFIRNNLANYMSRETNQWASNTKHVEVILNGEYQGIYLLMEEIKRDNDRVDIAKLLTTDISGEELTGGYIWEISGFGNDLGENRKLKYPVIADIMPEQFSYIQSFDNAFRTKMRAGSNTYSNPNTGYVEHINVESFLFEGIVQEAMRNSDAYGWSGYFHKDKNELIHAGPVWDFDQSAGNSSYPDNGVISGWMMNHTGTSNTPFFWPLFIDDPFFKYSMKLRWEELREEKYQTTKLLSYIDSIASLLTEAQTREFVKWPVLGANIWRETSGYTQRNTYQKEVDYLKSFLTQRWEWIDSQLSTVTRPNAYPSITVANSISNKKEFINQAKISIDLSNVFYFPYSSELKYSVSCSDPSIVNPNVKNKIDSLELKLLNIGSCEITVTAKDTYGNKKSTSFNLEVIDSQTSTFELSDNLKVYPNPAVNTINILFNSELSTSTSIEIYDLSGKMVDQIYSHGNNILGYNIEHLNSGIYLIKYRGTNKKAFTTKMVICR